MPMRSELAAPGARVASQITPNGYARSQIVEALQSPDVLVVLFSASLASSLQFY